MKAPEVGGAGVPAVLKEGQPGPHSRGPQAPFLGVIGFSKCRIDVFREDMEPPVEISLCASRQPALDIIATRKAPFRGYFGSRGSGIHLIFHASRIFLALRHPIDLTIYQEKTYENEVMPSHSAWYGGAPIYRP